MGQYMTEEDATGKWCPMVRVHMDDNEAVTNRGVKFFHDASENCLASGCMWWCKKTIRGATSTTVLGRCGMNTSTAKE